jgi:hypothetical protein
MTTATTITRLGATTAALVLLTGAALAAPVSAKDGADDNPSSLSDDSRNRSATDDNPGVSSDDSTNRASSKNRARTIKRGSCTAATDWKLKAKPRDGRIEVEFEVDSNVAGQRWTYTLRHDGVLKASGTRTTQAPSGSFSVERRLPNAPGVHSISATATNVSTGETCQASLRI